MIKNKVPEEFIALVAESIRQEQGSKISILGMFANGNIRISKDTKLPVNIPLGFYFLFLDGEGKFDTKVKLESPSKTILEMPFDPSFKQKDQPLTVSVVLPLVSLAELGDYKMTVTLDGKEFVRPFDLKQSDPPL